ncbi:Eukaryotic translation initiation factor 3 subunit B [Turdus rufiventris]|nr:Eukaryotic translation initiation factor 3 subunit B [Turdus rufiventris]
MQDTEESPAAAAPPGAQGPAEEPEHTDAPPPPAEPPQQQEREEDEKEDEEEEGGGESEAPAGPPEPPPAAEQPPSGRQSPAKAEPEPGSEPGAEPKSEPLAEPEPGAAQENGEAAPAAPAEPEDEISFSDPEDFVDDISDEELLGDILKDQPQEADGIDSVIVVDNVPQVGPDRLEKLKNVIHKIFSKFGKIINEFYPEADGKTKGYIFLEYMSPSHAVDAVKNADGYKLDKQHTFRVNLFTDFDKYMTISDEWEIPEKQPFKDLGNLRYWLEDPDCRDQYSVIFESGDRTSIFWNDIKEPVQIEDRARWTETYVRWSPKGTYLATFHQRGIALWGGEKFKQIQRFSHQGVQLIDFSPCERYLVTFSPLMDTQDDPQAIIIWDILTGQKKRGFHCENSAHWPIFKWSHDGKFFARMTSDTLSIYETPSMGLLDKKSLKINGIRDFSWSPGGNIIAFWVPEDKDIPARVTLMQLPSRQEIRVRNLFNVVDCKLHWQKNGDYLCVKVDRTPKGTQGVVTNFEIFRMREKQVPVDVVEMKAFVDTSDCTMMNIAEHYTASDVEWDPTGRYIVTSVSWWSHKQIKKDLKKYSKIFEQKDRLSQSKASKARRF